mmetsp:Transcript_18571/g.26053  ORF Transcript_18571/g.26053 Transcript_18571/m.26053 type:complete len:243 (-) Transcript_18571:120-848(-)
MRRFSQSIMQIGQRQSIRSFLPVANAAFCSRLPARLFSDASASVTCTQPHTKPTIAQAKEMSRHCCEMSNDVLLAMAYEEYQPAREERLVREIMAVDEVEWEEANKIAQKMKADNKMSAATIPYKIGLFTALFAAGGSIPMVFSLNTALWFNEDFVTTDVPEPRDLETFLEVGSWTWGWMEPPLGTISFVLLCLQFSRNQLTNLGWQPYTQRVKMMRAKNLCAAYPKYDPEIVSMFAVGEKW